MKKILLAVLFAIAGITQCLTAQVNGTPVTPAISTSESPIYYYIESASDGSYSYSNYTGDFRGEVIISPDVAGKLIHNTLATATSEDHAKWAIVMVDGVPKLQNKATSLFMTASHSCNATGTKFLYTSIGNNQYVMRTEDVASYTITWKNNLLDRLNIGLNQNSLVAWYFIPDPVSAAAALKLSLKAKISEGDSLLKVTTAGTDFGQYAQSDRDLLIEEIANSQTLYEFPTTTLDEINIAIQNLDAAMVTFKASINSNPLSLITTNPDNYRWYWIRSYATGLPSIFGKVISGGERTVGQKYIYTSKAAIPGDEQLFRFVLNADNTKVLSIIDKNGNYMASNGTISSASTDGNEFTLTPQSDGIAFWIEPTSLAALRANDGGSIDNWRYLAGGASSWVFDFAFEKKKIPTVDAPRTVTVTSGDAAKGSAVITGTSDLSVNTDLESVSVTANPISGFFFTKWTNLAGDSISVKNPYIYRGADATTLVANFENGYYKVLNRYYTGTPSTQSADRYLTDVKAIVNGVDQPILTAVTANPNPIDAAVLSNQLTPDAVVDCSAPQIEVPLGTSTFDINCISSFVTLENLKWTQQNVFIDWNKDFDFLDANEAGLATTTGADGAFIDPAGYTRTITIPVEVQEGFYKMRMIFHEPSSVADWSTSIWTNNYIRNGVAYDFSIKYGSPAAVKNVKSLDVKVLKVANGFKVLNAQNTNLTLTDLSGRLISTVKVLSADQMINVPSARGIYFATLKFQTGEKVSVKVIR